MSSAESQSTSQTPRREVLDRMAEQLPAWGIPHLLGVQHLANMLSAARGRVNDSHKMQIQSLAQTTGCKISDAASNIGEAEDVAGINVQGDTTNHVTIMGTAPQPPASLAKKAMPYLLAAALGGGAAWAIPFLKGWQTSRPQPQSTDYQLRLEVKDTP